MKYGSGDEWSLASDTLRLLERKQAEKQVITEGLDGTQTEEQVSPRFLSFPSSESVGVE